MKIKYVYGLIIFGTIIGLMNSCEIFDCIEGNGIPESEQRLVAEFEGWKIRPVSMLKSRRTALTVSKSLPTKIFCLMSKLMSGPGF